MTNGAKLRVRRDVVGLTQSAAADMSSVAQSNWSAHESDTRPLSEEMLVRLSTAIGFRPRLSVEAHRERIREVCAEHGAREPRVFGSAADGTDTAASDLDLLVLAEPGMTMFDLTLLEQELENLCGVRVDVVTDGALAEAPEAWSWLTTVAV